MRTHYLPLGRCANEGGKDLMVVGSELMDGSGRELRATLCDCEMLGNRTVAGSVRFFSNTGARCVGASSVRSTTCC